MLKVNATCVAIMYSKKCSANPLFPDICTYIVMLVLCRSTQTVGEA